MADIVTNPKARRDYHILETFEAGIVLHGTEVKALRAGKGQIADAFARVDNDEVWLYNAHIDEYSHGNLQNHQPKAAAQTPAAQIGNPQIVRAGGGQRQRAVAAVVLLEKRQGEGRAGRRQGQGAVRQTRGPETARIGPRTEARPDAPVRKADEAESDKAEDAASPILDATIASLYFRPCRFGFFQVRFGALTTRPS